MTITTINKISMSGMLFLLRFAGVAKNKSTETIRFLNLHWSREIVLSVIMTILERIAVLKRVFPREEELQYQPRIILDSHLSHKNNTNNNRIIFL